MTADEQHPPCRQVKYRPLLYWPLAVATWVLPARFWPVRACWWYLNQSQAKWAKTAATQTSDPKEPQ